MLDGLLLAEYPGLPTGITIRHHPKNNLGHFQPRLAQTDCSCSYQRQSIFDKGLPASGRFRTIWNPFRYGGSRHGYSCIRARYWDAEDITAVQDLDFYKHDQRKNEAFLILGGKSPATARDQWITSHASKVKVNYPLVISAQILHKYGSS